MPSRINNLNNLKFIRTIDGNFLNLWNLFLKKKKIYSYRYNLEYIDIEKSAFENNFIDESFIIIKDENPIAIIPLIVDMKNNYLSYRNEKYSPTPLLSDLLEEKQKNDLEKILFDKIKIVIDKYSIKRWYLTSDPLSYINDNYLDMFGDKILATDCSYLNRIIELKNSKDYLWSQIRNSYKNIINKSLKVFKFNIVNHSNMNNDIGEKYIKLHEKCSGRMTRPIESFNKMNDLIKQKKAVLFEQYLNSNIVQMEIVLLGKNCAAGGSVADDPDIKTDLPLTHSMNYTICMELAKIGLKYYEIGGSQYKDDIFNPLTNKQFNITMFKRGFGKKSKLFRRWIWFDTRIEEKKFYEEKTKSFS